jgi:uncharacterized protein YjbJ (UPF0337 family)
MTTASSTDQQTFADTSAAEEGRRVAGVAQEEAGNVAAEAKDQVTNLVDQAKSQVSEQGGVQRDRLVQTLNTLGDDLDHMAEQSDRSGIATDLARQAAGRIREVSNRLDGREPSLILDDVRAFARRRPGAFLLGALAAGVVAGRITRGAKESQSSSGSEGSSTSSFSGYGGSEGSNGYPTVSSGVGVPVETAVIVEETSYSRVGQDPLQSTADFGAVGSDIPHDRGAL